MTGHTSQNTPPRNSAAPVTRTRRALVCTLAALAFMAVALLAVDRVPDTHLGRTIDLHLSQLADPHSWIP